MRYSSRNSLSSIIFYVIGISFNQPHFCAKVNWTQDGITFANRSVVGSRHTPIFIDTNNTIYVINGEKNKTLVWSNNSLNPTEIILGNFSGYSSIFVTSNGDIYIDDGEKNNVVKRWISKNKTFDIVMNVNSSCSDLFIDINDHLYCSISHQVAKRDLKSSSMTPIIVAGTGYEGSASNELFSPLGIFVDVNSDLFVADTRNNRIQLFPFGEMNAITVAGRGSYKPTISLDTPSGIVLDAKKYLFIVDGHNNRIVGEGPYGFRCLVGCYGKGSESSQWTWPSAMSFDVFGNMFVAELSTHQIQKFELIENSCGEFIKVLTMVKTSNSKTRKSPIHNILKKERK